MKLTEYLGVSAAVLQDYINSGLINAHHHKQFPLVLFSYSRKCQYENLWPEPVRKCRGLIVREDTDEIIARPFEKFFNLETENLEKCLVDMSGTGVVEESKLRNIAREPDMIYEKMDGFMCTLYEWEGKSYIASKGSFDSPHSKWATAVYTAKLPIIAWPHGFTPVFEGLTKNLRIVVDYGDREELVLIGLINIETGEEINGMALKEEGRIRGFNTPPILNEKLADVNHVSLLDGDLAVKNFEGYVAVWVRPGQTPFRLKIKFLDYLRIHRMVCGVSPKRVLEALMNGWQSEIKEWTDESTPWFNNFVSRWTKALQRKYDEIDHGAKASYDVISSVLKQQWVTTGNIPVRKDWALLIQRPEFLAYAPVLFAMLDGKKAEPIIWKMVKPMVKNSNPLVNSEL